MPTCSILRYFLSNFLHYAVDIQIARPDLSMISVGLSSTLQTEILTNSFSLLNPIDYARALLKMIEKMAGQDCWLFTISLPNTMQKFLTIF